MVPRVSDAGSDFVLLGLCGTSQKLETNVAVMRPSGRQLPLHFIREKKKTLNNPPQLCPSVPKLQFFFSSLAAEI